MSAENDSRATRDDRPAATGERDGRAVRAEESDDFGGAEPSDRGKSVTVGGIDCGGPPIEDPGATQQSVAARERLWRTYRGRDADGDFVWLGSAHGDGLPEDKERWQML
jgi:hypothetical protein